MSTALAPSLLDRLLEASAGVAEPQPARVDRLVDDLEELLNTCCVGPSESLTAHRETATSLLAYGAPAPQSLAIATYPERLAAARMLQRVIERFEPRLSRVRVLVEAQRRVSNDGRFRIDAQLTDGSQLSLPVSVRNTSGRTQVTAERS